MKKHQNLYIFLIWLLWAILGLAFHEPWRDEAQAWLVSINSKSLSELLFRSSLEATGPLYYFLIKIFSSLTFWQYPLSLQVISLLGSALLVYKILSCRWINNTDKILLIASYIVAFEIANISRLYGWGLFFLFSGICADKNQKTLWALFWWTLTIFTQLSFVFPIFGWLVYQHLSPWSIDKNKNLLRRYFPLGIALVFMWWHQSLAAEHRNWIDWTWPKSFEILGSHMAAPFIHTRGRLGIIGIILGLFAIYALPKRAKIPFACTYLLFLIVFAFHYGHYAGPAKPRHAAGVFLLWFLFCAIEENKKLTHYTKLIMLIISIASGLEAKVFDFRSHFSDALPIVRAHTLQNDPPKEIQFFLKNHMFAYSFAPFAETYLMQTMRPIVFPAFTKKQKSENTQLNPKQLGLWFEKRCQTVDCIVVLRKGEPLELPNPNLSVSKFYSGTDTFTDESLDAYLVRFVSP